MKSGELANACLDVCIEAQRRIINEGDKQYSRGDTQKFEIDSFGDHLKELEEELLDCINYSAMTVLKLRMLIGRADEL